MACDYFIYSLNDPNLALKVRERSPKDLDSALKIALQLEVWANDAERTKQEQQPKKLSRSTACLVTWRTLLVACRPVVASVEWVIECVGVLIRLNCVECWMFAIKFCNKIQLKNMHSTYLASWTGCHLIPRELLSTSSLLAVMSTWMISRARAWTIVLVGVVQWICEGVHRSSAEVFFWRSVCIGRQLSLELWSLTSTVVIPAYSEQTDYMRRNIKYFAGGLLCLFCCYSCIWLYCD